MVSDITPTGTVADLNEGAEGSELQLFLEAQHARQQLEVLSKLPTNSTEARAIMKAGIDATENTTTHRALELLLEGFEYSQVTNQLLRDDLKALRETIKRKKMTAERFQQSRYSSCKRIRARRLQRLQRRRKGRRLRRGRKRGIDQWGGTCCQKTAPRTASKKREFFSNRASRGAAGYEGDRRGTEIWGASSTGKGNKREAC